MYKICIITNKNKEARFFQNHLDCLNYFKVIINDKSFLGKITLFYIEDDKEIEIISKTVTK